MLEALDILGIMQLIFGLAVALFALDIHWISDARKGCDGVLFVIQVRTQDFYPPERKLVFPECYLEIFLGVSKF